MNQPAHEETPLPAINSNLLYATIAALAMIAVVLGYQLYEAKKEPKGFQINIGPGGVSMEKK
jgi:hypothetical protein